MESFAPFHLIDVLNKFDVPFVIIGGHAVSYHGHIRATEDTDVVFSRNPDSEYALFKALAHVNAHWIGNELDPTTGIETCHPVTMPFVRSNHLIMVTTDFGFLDIFDYIPGMPNEDMEQLFATAVECDGRRFVSLPWLRAMKEAANRPKDQLDLENLPTDS